MSLLFAVAVVLAPGVFALISGRRLIALANDPTFADRNLARSRRLGMVAITSLILGPALAAGSIWWTAPLTILVLIAGCFPARRRLFDERWSFGEYVRYTVFAGIGMLGFWVLLVMTPSIISGVGELDWRAAAVASVVLATLLLVCQADYPAFWRAMHRAAPLARPDLEASLAAVTARARCTAPTVHRFGAPGSHSMNALALPHRNRPGVALGETLLERLDVEEITAVFAHEVAHLEQFSREHMRRMTIITSTLILLSTALTAVLVTLAPGHALWLTLGLMLAVLLTLSSMAAKSQANETACDLRAVELTGDPEALVRALTKLHLHLHLPRHWPHEQEKSLSHPSLARRIQAIRGRTSGAAPALPGTAVARAPVGGARVALDESRAYWFEGVPAETPDDLASLREQASSYRALAYADLSELRLVSAGSGKSVKARDLDGQAWLVSIRTEDVPAVQQALEVVDARIGERRKVNRRADVRLLAVAMLLALVAAGQLGVVLLPLAVALVRPSTAAAAALGAMIVARAAATLMAGELGDAGVTATVGTAVMLIGGAVALWLVWRRRGASPAEREPRPTQLVLGIGAAVILVLLAPLALDAAPSTILSHPLLMALAVVGIGLAATLWTRNERSWRRGGMALAGVATVVVLAGAARASAMMGPPLAITEMAATRISEITLDEVAYRVELAPDGATYAVQLAIGGRSADPYSEDAPSSRWRVATLSGVAAEGTTFDGIARRSSVRELDALDLAFVDDSRIIALSYARADSLEVRVEAALDGVRTASGATWRIGLPELIAPLLHVDHAEGRWMVTGHLESGEVVAYAGTVASSHVRTHRWPATDRWLQPVAIGADGSGIAIATRGPRGPLQFALSALTGPALRFDVLRSDARGWSRTGTMDGVPRCSIRGRGAVCITAGGDANRMLLVSDSGTIHNAGALPDGYDVPHAGHGEQLVARSYTAADLLVLEPRDASAMRILVEKPAGAQHAMIVDAAVVRGTLATLEVDDGRSMLRVYRPQ